MKSNDSNFITRQQVVALMRYKLEQVLQHLSFHLCWRKVAVLFSCVGIAGEMEACTKNSSVRFKQRTLIEFLTVGRNVSGRNGNTYCYDCRVRTGIHFQMNNTVIPTRKTACIAQFQSEWRKETTNRNILRNSDEMNNATMDSSAYTTDKTRRLIRQLCDDLHSLSVL